jgi:hypothetical protein
VQFTVVEPTANVDPVGGAHVTLTGSVPPVVVGDPYWTTIGCPEGDCIDTDAGHVILRSAGGGELWVGLPLQAAASRTPTPTSARLNPTPETA